MSRALVGVAVVGCLAAGVAVVIVPGAAVETSHTNTERVAAAGDAASRFSLEGHTDHGGTARTASDTSATTLTTDAGTPILYCTIHTAAATMPEIDIYTMPEVIAREGEWRVRYYCPADFNKDDVIDASDLALFMAVFAAQDGPMQPWLDVNQDGEATPLDLEHFLDVFEKGDCDPNRAKETRLIAC